MNHIDFHPKSLYKLTFCRYMRKYIPCLSILILIASLGLISGCQPPASGESAGFRYPFLYSQLMNKKLSGQLPVPVEGVTRKQLQDTWGAARSEGRKHEGIDIFAKRGHLCLVQLKV